MSSAQDREKRNQVLRALGDNQALANVSFDIGGFMVTPSKLAWVREHILAGEIEVVYDPALSNMATYEVEDDVLSLGNFDYPDADAEMALIIHECTHAMMDRYGWDISDVSSEVVAYVAQMLYYLGRKPGAQMGYIHDHEDDKVIRPAFGYAKFLTDRRKGLAKGDPASLRAALDKVVDLTRGVMSHPAYLVQFAESRAKLDGKAGFNGVKGYQYFANE